MSGECLPEPTSQTLMVDGHQIAVIDGRRGKSGPPVVFIHGVLMSVGFWPRVFRGTSLDEYRWISVGLPGHFPSSAPDQFQQSDVTEALFARCLSAAVRHFFEEEPVHLIGWSTGGFAALVTAAANPELVLSVVSLSGFARGRWSSKLGYLQRVAQSRWRGWTIPIGMKLVGCSSRLHRFLQWTMTTKRVPRTKLIAEVTELSFQDYRQHDPVVMRTLFAGLRDIDCTAELSKMTVPVLVLAGEKDRIICPEEAKHLHEHLPNSRLVEQADVGHLFFIEGREQSLMRIDEWIRDQSQASI